MTNDSGLENTSNGVSDTVVNRSIAEDASTPRDKGFHHVDLRGQRQDGDLLRAEVHDGNTVVKAADASAETVHCANCGIAFHDGQRKTPDGYGAADDAPHGLRQCELRRRGLLRGTEDGLWRKADVVE